VGGLEAGIKHDQFKFPEACFGCCGGCRVEVRSSGGHWGETLWPSGDGAERSDLGV